MGRNKTTNAGKYYTAADFDLTGLTYEERCLVFLWACGEDITDWLGDRHVDRLRGTGRVPHSSPMYNVGYTE